MCDPDDSSDPDTTLVKERKTGERERKKQLHAFIANTLTFPPTALYIYPWEVDRLLLKTRKIVVLVLVSMTHAMKLQCIRMCTTCNIVSTRTRLRDLGIWMI